MHKSKSLQFLQTNNHITHIYMKYKLLPLDFPLKYKLLPLFLAWNRKCYPNFKLRNRNCYLKVKVTLSISQCWLPYFKHVLILTKIYKECCNSGICAPLLCSSFAVPRFLMNHPVYRLKPIFNIISFFYKFINSPDCFKSLFDNEYKFVK